MRRIVQTVAVLALIFLGSTFGGMLAESRRTLASRDGSGNYTLPAGSMNPAVAGTPIKSADMNTTLSDLKTEMTDSLSRSAKGAMLGALRLNAGASASAPDLAWGAETNSGLWRSASNVFRFSVAGTDKTFWNATGFGIGAAAAGGFPMDVSAINGSDSTRFGTSLAMLGNAPSIGFNLHNDGTNKYMTSFPGAILSWDVTGSGQYIFYTAPTGTAGNTATITERVRISPSGTTFSTGLAADGSGFKHQSVAGCATTASIGATCTSTLTWTSTFADTSYQAQCTCNATTSGHPIIESYTIAAGSITITTTALTAAAAQCAVITCAAEHN